ncbi:MAG TPA: hypothetical protein QF764_06315 [Planctomycetota bacterium]|nr:hypothetical protein [Planctomycetota bacterium]
MTSQVARSRLVLAVSAPLALAGMLLWAWSLRGADNNALERDLARGEAQLVEPADLVPQEERALETYVPSVRTEAAAPPKARTTAAERATQPPAPVIGTVLDELGRPVAGVIVGIVRGSSRVSGASGRGPVWWEGSGLSYPSPGGPSPFGTPTETGHVTDDHGSFELPGVRAVDGDLVFAARLYLGEPPRQAFLPGGVNQFLQLPRRPASVPAVIVHLTDAESGARVYPQRVGAELVALLPQPRDSERHTGPLPPARGRRHPLDQHVQRQDGRVDLNLWPGRWRLSLANEHSSTVDLEVVVPVAGPAIEIDAQVTLYAARDGWELLDPAALDGPALVADASLGFDACGPEHYHDRAFGDRRMDAHFRRTLRFGAGAVRAARLELDLEAASGMAHNDTLQLEFTGGSPRFVFTTSMTALAGGAWRPPRRKHFSLDLGNLTGGNGELSLLEELADGRLDIYLADDTAVHGLRLFVAR